MTDTGPREDGESIPAMAAGRRETLRLLREHRTALADRFGVTGLSLFGSFARNQAADDSDVDLLVEFDGPGGLDGYFGAVAYLEDLLGRTVDLVTDEALRREVRPYVEAESLDVFDENEGLPMPTDHKPKREWRFYVEDMIDSCEQVMAYTEGLDQAGFIANRIIYDATIRNIEIIGEGAAHVPDAVRKAHRDIPWGLIIGTRNRIVHVYHGIDNRVVWNIIRKEIPSLLPKLKAALG